MQAAQGLDSRAVIWHTGIGEQKAKMAATIHSFAPWKARPPLERFSSGVAEVDALTGGLPRGAITEIAGPASSGRTSLLLAMLAEATHRQEICTVVDASDTLNPASAAAAGVDLGRLLWVRCGGNPEHALRAADLLVQGGGLGCVALDLGDLPPRIARRIPLACWFRLRRALENTPTVLVALGQVSCASSCASLVLELKQGRLNWSGTPDCSRLLKGALFEAGPRKPVVSAVAAFQARALG